MHEHDSPEQKGYELSDVQVKIVLYSGVGVVVMTLIAYIVSTFFVKYFRAEAPMTRVVATPLAVEEEGKPWQLPVRLQVEPGRAEAEVKAEQAKVKASFGEVSDKPEIYQIPVEKAIDIVAEKGLPVFPKVPAGPAKATTPAQAPRTN